MKKLPLILSIIALAGMVVLFVMNFTGKETSDAGANVNDNAQLSGDLKIAYVLSDSILFNYQLAIDLNNDFMSKQSQYNAEFSEKRTNLEKQAVAFQEKLQKGGFLSEERAIRERDRILGEEQDMQRLDQELSTKLARMEQEINIQLVDSIVNYVKEYNQKHGYTYIFSNSGNIIVGAQQFNITKDILDGLNSRYTASKK
ncbi:MAG TPA: OmpH family outer membrane protein [Prolixibacteraceae bacterium]|nr:OmpH family outer membrane protein [Prolixibacteraceae bacterium]